MALINKIFSNQSHLGIIIICKNILRNIWHTFTGRHKLPWIQSCELYTTQMSGRFGKGQVTDVEYCQDLSESELLEDFLSLLVNCKF